MELFPTNSPTPETKKTPTTSEGQPSGPKSDAAHQGQRPAVSAEAHYRSDVDSSQKALHHSLGPGRNQSAPGSHTHDGVSSTKLGGRKFDTTAGNEGKTIPALTITGSRTDGSAVVSIIALLSKFVDFVDNTTA